MRWFLERAGADVLVQLMDEASAKEGSAEPMGNRSDRTVR